MLIIQKVFVLCNQNEFSHEIDFYFFLMVKLAFAIRSCTLERRKLQ